MLLLYSRGGWYKLCSPFMMPSFCRHQVTLCFLECLWSSSASATKSTHSSLCWYLYFDKIRYLNLKTPANLLVLNHHLPNADILFYFLVFSVLKMVTFLSVSACCPCVCSRNCLGCSDVWQFKDYQVIHLSQHIPQFERKRISFLLMLLYRSSYFYKTLLIFMGLWI